MKGSNFIYELVQEHIRQMQEEYHIEAFTMENLRNAQKHLKSLDVLKDSQQELRISNSCFNDGVTVEFCMLFDNRYEARKFAKALKEIHPYFKIER